MTTKRESFVFLESSQREPYKGGKCKYKYRTEIKFNFATKLHTKLFPAIVEKWKNKIIRDLRQTPCNKR